MTSLIITTVFLNGPSVIHSASASYFSCLDWPILSFAAAVSPAAGLSVFSLRLVTKLSIFSLPWLV